MYHFLSELMTKKIMKTKMKNYLKFTLVLGISLFLFNCQIDHNLDEIITTESGNNLAFKNGRLQNLQKLNSYVKDLKRNLKVASINKESSLEDTYNFIIIEDQDILIYQEGANTTYTIPILKAEQEVGTFSNLVVKFSDTSQTEAFIINYEPNDGFLEAAENYHQTPFSGSITKESLQYDGSLDNLNENANPNCTTITIMFCNWSEGNVEGTTHLAGKNCTPSFMFSVSYEACDDFPELVDPPSSSSGSNSPNDGFPNTPSGGNTNTNDAYDNPVIIPTVPNVESILNIDGISFEMNNWLNENLDVKLELIALLNENPGGEDFILEAIEALMADDQLTLEVYLAQQITVEGPEIVIEDIEEYLDCFDTTQPAQITIYVDQPISGSRRPYTYTGNVGHAFVGITQGGITRVLGLYPQGNGHPFAPEDPRVYGNDAGHGFDVSISKNITASQLNSIINETINNQTNYNLNSNNCSNYAIRMCILSDINAPSTLGTWPLGGGNNPGDLGEDIREIDQLGTNINGNGGTSPENNGNC